MTDASSVERENCINTISWQRCALSQKKLVKPIVSDYKGNLFNKEEVLKYLIEKKMHKLSNEKFHHINSLSDFVELKILKGDSFQCPISGEKISQDESARNPDFAYIVPCGCVLGRKVVCEIVSLVKKKENTIDDVNLPCPNCSDVFNSLNVVDINSKSDEARNRAEERMEKLNEEKKTHSLKKVKVKKHKLHGDKSLRKRVKV